MMKIKLIMRLFALGVGIVLITAGSVLALPYYEAGTIDNNTAATGLALGYYNSGTSQFSTSSNGGTQAIRFTGIGIYGPSGDVLADPYTYTQTISGIYNLSSAGNNIYNLGLVSGSNSTIKVTDGSSTFLQATASALQIDFTNNTIAWSSISNVTINNTIGSTALADMSTSDRYSFTFSFEQITNESTWLTGSSSGGNARYYSQLSGLSPLPEPGEWALILLGLGLIGFYMHRRGLLNWGASPQITA